MSTTRTKLSRFVRRLVVVDRLGSVDGWDGMVGSFLPATALSIGWAWLWQKPREEKKKTWFFGYRREKVCHRIGLGTHQLWLRRMGYARHLKPSTEERSAPDVGAAGADTDG